MSFGWMRWNFTNWFWVRLLNLLIQFHLPCGISHRSSQTGSVKQAEERRLPNVPVSQTATVTKEQPSAVSSERFLEKLSLIERFSINKVCSFELQTTSRQAALSRPIIESLFACCHDDTVSMTEIPYKVCVLHIAMNPLASVLEEQCSGFRTLRFRAEHFKLWKFKLLKV